MEKLNAISPLQTLDRGYAIITKADHSIVRDAKNVKSGEIVEAQLAQGKIKAEVI